MDKKRLYIMRGTPGAGKSKEAHHLAGNSGLVLSTDDFWEEVCEGRVALYRMGEAHSWNFNRFLTAVEQGEELIIIDNTNMQRWEFQNYDKVGRMYGYAVQIVDVTPQTIEDVLMAGRRNIHNVPLSKCLEMFEKYQPFPCLKGIDP